MFVFRLVMFLVILFVQWYFYQAVATIIKDYSEVKRNIIRYSYFSIAGIILLVTFISIFYSFQFWPKPLKVTFSTFMLVVFLSQLIGILPLLPDDIIRFFRWAYVKVFSKPELVDDGAAKITRLKFFSYLAVGAAAIPAAGLFYGFLKGGYDYRVRRVKLTYPNLPEEFNGFKIAQISDIHTGSFMTPRPLITAFNKILDQKPDVIFFTGDLVNDLHTETEGFESVFKMLKSPNGVYSIFGNHDYADYYFRDPEDEGKKKEAQELLKMVHKKAGWNLMMNEHRYIERNGQRIGLVGVENWDARRGFSQYGDLQKAVNGMEDVPFKILLSHSPSHWDAVVNKEFKDIDLTLSGHTHGMQFGIEIPGFKWSPVKYIYPQWAGMYHKENQVLYVNRGLGFIGYNGRLGIWPEITVIELYKGEKKYEEV